MEIPAVVLLYAVLLAGATAVLLYIFVIYDDVVYNINLHACQEAATLTRIALQRALSEPGNYTGKIALYYAIEIKGGEIVVGLDTSKPATCPLEVPRDVKVLDSTGDTIVVEKKVRNFVDCDCGNECNPPKLGVKDGRYIIVTKCEEGVKVEAARVEVYAS